MYDSFHPFIRYFSSVFLSEKCAKDVESRRPSGRDRWLQEEEEPTVLVLALMCGSVSRCWRGLLHVCVCVSFLFLECPFFSWWATPVLVPGGHKTGKKGQLVFFFFLLFIKSHYWEDYRPYKESHRRDGSVCVFHYPRDQIASSSAHNRRKILFSCFLVLFGRKDFFFFRL